MEVVYADGSGRIITLWFSMKDPAGNILHAAGHGVWRSLTQSCIRAAEPDWDVLAEATTNTQGSKTADEHLLVFKEEGNMPLASPLESMYLRTVCRDHSWSVRSL
jgi:hypothetical protein